MDCCFADKQHGIKFEPNTLSLLESIALAEYNHNPLSVGDLMKITEIASPATLHRKMRSLENDYWVKLEVKGTNKRVKYVLTTTKTQQFMSHRGRLLMSALN